MKSYPNNHGYLLYIKIHIFLYNHHNLLMYYCTHVKFYIRYLITNAELVNEKFIDFHQPSC